MTDMNRKHPESARQHVAVPVARSHGHLLEAARVFTDIGYMHIQTLPVCIPAVWWGVQCSAGGPGWVSKEGWQNQRVGGENPGPGVSGKSHYPVEQLHFPTRSSFNVFFYEWKQEFVNHIQKLFEPIFIVKFSSPLSYMMKSNIWPPGQAWLAQKDFFSSRFETCCCCKWSYHPYNNVWFNNGSVFSFCGITALLKLFLCNSIVRTIDCISCSWPSHHFFSVHAENNYHLP